MFGRFPVLIEDEDRGELLVSRSGAMVLFEAVAEYSGPVLRLSVYGEGREGYLGVMSPGAEQGKVALKKRLSRAQLRAFPQNIEFAAPSGRTELRHEPEPEQKTESEPQPEPMTPADDDTLWYSSPDGTLSSFDGERLLIALPAADPRVPSWAGDLVRVINGRKYVVFPW